MLYLQSINEVGRMKKINTYIGDESGFSKKRSTIYRIAPNYQKTCDIFSLEADTATYYNFQRNSIP